MADLNWNSRQLTHGWQRGVTAFFYGLDMTEADFDTAFERRQQPAMSHEMKETLPLFDETGALRPFADIESDILEMAQQHCGGSLSQAAKALGLGRSTLYRKLEKYNL